MAQIVLDAEAFKALSSDTRLQILKALDARRLTVSELGRLLDLNKATVFEHLKQLAAADLVKKEDEGRKWVYYKLTWKGRNVLHPENVQFMIMLGVSALSLGGLVAYLGNLLSWWGAPTTSSEVPGGDDRSQPEPSPEGLADSAGDGNTTAGQQSAAPSTPAATDDGDSAAPEKSEGGPGGEAPGDGGSAADERLWEDTNLWLVLLLTALVLTTALFAYQYVRVRRRDRTELLRRIQRLPPPDADEAAPAN